MRQRSLKCGPEAWVTKQFNQKRDLTLKYGVALMPKVCWHAHRLCPLTCPLTRCPSCKLNYELLFCFAVSFSGLTWTTCVKMLHCFNAVSLSIQQKSIGQTGKQHYPLQKERQPDKLKCRVEITWTDVLINVQGMFTVFGTNETPYSSSCSPFLSPHIYQQRWLLHKMLWEVITLGKTRSRSQK